MTRPTLRLLCLCTAALALSLAAFTAPAFADRDEIIADCADDGQLQGDYSASELRDARKNLPSDISEYTDCADVLRRGELPSGGGSSSGATGAGAPGAAGGGGSGPAGGAAPGPATPEETRKLEQVAAGGGGKPVAVGGREVVPGASGLTPDAARNGIPGTLVAVLLLLLLAGAVAALPALRRRMRDGGWPWNGTRPGLFGRG